MTNPNNMVRVRARNGGRASVYEANGWAQAYNSGILEGAGVTQNTVADMNVLVGGSSNNPEVVLAENPAGYRIALDLVSQQAIAITAPATNSRISAIVAYTDDLSLATTEDTVTGSPASCGLIVVNGTASISPTEPTDNQIRTAITSDGATGSQAAYCIIATIEVASGTSAITNSEITNNIAQIKEEKVDFGPVLALSDYSTTEQDTGITWINGDTIYKKTVSLGQLPSGTTSVNTPHNISNLGWTVKMEGIGIRTSDHVSIPLPYAAVSSDPAAGIRVTIGAMNVTVQCGRDSSAYDGYVTIYYTKQS